MSQHKSYTANDSNSFVKGNQRQQQTRDKGEERIWERSMTHKYNLRG